MAYRWWFLLMPECNLQQQQRQVAEKHEEMQRHLDDMREWYRRKLRELAGTKMTTAPATEPLPVLMGMADASTGLFSSRTLGLVAVLPVARA